MPSKLLFDQNLSPLLVGALVDLYPGAAHVRSLGLHVAGDDVIWQRARADGFTIVTKDDDFRQMSFLYGAPPKVIWVRLGNCSTGDVEAVLRDRHSDILRFVEDPTAALLVFRRGRPTGSQ